MICQALLQKSLPKNVRQAFEFVCYSADHRRAATASQFTSFSRKLAR